MEERCSFYQITVTPPELQFSVEEGPLPPDAQFLHVAKTGPGELPPRWSYAADVHWLDPRCSTTGVPADIMIRFRTGGMAAGDYEGHITFATEPQQTPIVILVKGSIIPKPEPVEPLEITTAAVPAGTQGQDYSCRFEAKGGKPPYAWVCVGEPPGLSLDSETGELVGIPTSSGAFKITINVMDDTGTMDSKDYTLNIKEAPEPPLKVNITSPAGGEVWYEGDIHEIKWTAENAEGETLAIVVLYGNVQDPIAHDVPIKSLSYSWLIETEPNESNKIKIFLPGGSTLSKPFAIRDRPGCSPFALFIKTFNRVRLHISHRTQKGVVFE